MKIRLILVALESVLQNKQTLLRIEYRVSGLVQCRCVLFNGGQLCDARQHMHQINLWKDRQSHFGMSYNADSSNLAGHNALFLGLYFSKG